MVLGHSMGWAFRTLDGAGTFHGMGNIGAATPSTKRRKAIRREVTATLETVSCIMGKVFIRYFMYYLLIILLMLPSSICHWTTRRCCRTSLLRIKERYSTVLGRYPSPYPGWSQMMQSVCNGIYPGQSTFLSYP